MPLLCSMASNPTVEVGFLAERLAAAKAVPASQRSPEVADFIEACRLKDEAMALLAEPLPGGAAAGAAERSRRMQASACCQGMQQSLAGQSAF